MRIEINRIKKIVNNLFLFITRHAFLVSLLLFLLALFFGSFLFYQYIILAQKVEPEVSERPFLINEKNYESILKFWQKNEKTFLEADFKIYPDPFKKPAITPGKELTE